MSTITPAYLVTHSGGFHTDEVFSSVILTRLVPQAQVIRSRAAEWVTRPVPTASSMTSVAPMMPMWEHSTTASTAHPCAGMVQPFSSFGLIWRHFGNDY